MPTYTLVEAASEVVDWVHVMRAQGIDIAESAGRKALHECQEFVDNPCLEEAADVFIALLSACTGQGWTQADLTAAVIDKMEVNRGRSWEKLADGTWQHVTPSRRITPNDILDFTPDGRFPG